MDRGNECLPRRVAPRSRVPLCRCAGIAGSRQVGDRPLSRARRRRLPGRAFPGESADAGGDPDRGDRPARRGGRAERSGDPAAREPPSNRRPRREDPRCGEARRNLDAAGGGGRAAGRDDPGFRRGQRGRSAAGVGEDHAERAGGGVRGLAGFGDGMEARDFGFRVFFYWHGIKLG